MSAKENIRTESHLLERIQNPDDSAGWDEFYQVYRGLVHRLAMKSGLTDEEAKDVVQEVMIGINRNIPGFVYDRSKCSFKTWLSQLVRWRILDRLAMRQQKDVSCTQADTPKESLSPELLVGHSESDLEARWDTEWRKALLEAAADRLEQSVKAKHFQVFYLHVLKGIPPTQVARMLNVGVAQVYLVKFRLSPIFRRILKVLEAEGTI